MLRERIVVALILIPLAVGMLLAGGVLFAGCVVVVLGMAAWEYSRLFSKPGMVIPPGIVAAGVAGLIILRWGWGFDHVGIAVTGILFANMLWFLVRFERGMDRQAASAMVITLGGTLYLGWFSAYFVSLRQLPYGLWWMLICLAAVALTDSMAFFVGQRWGKHPLTKLISPKKTWEGLFRRRGGRGIGRIGNRLGFPNRRVFRQRHHPAGRFGGGDIHRLAFTARRSYYQSDETGSGAKGFGGFLPRPRGHPGSDRFLDGYGGGRILRH